MIELSYYPNPKLQLPQVPVTLQQVLLQQLHQRPTTVQLYSEQNIDRPWINNTEKLAQAYMSNGQVYQARQLLLEGLAHCPTHARLWYALLTTCEQDCPYLAQVLGWMQKQQFQLTDKMQQKITKICQESVPMPLTLRYG